jgi:hypothetical protein
MSVEGKSKFLLESLNRQIADFAGWGRNNRYKAFWIKMLITSFGALTTILLGLQGLESKTFLNINATILVKNIALILSALVTLLSAWDAFFNHRTLWISYTNTAYQLQAIRAEIQFLTSEGSESLKEEDVNRLYQKYQSVLNEADAQWIKLRNAETGKSE